MNEYIEKSALLRSLKSSGAASDFELYKISNFPTADVVPVVRCKECEHWGTRKADGYGFCCIWGSSVKEDAFCSSGVKRRTAE